jgi:very-short-patch-repair endonuclease
MPGVLLGSKHTAIAKKRMSKALKGRKHTLETKLKIAAAHKGRTASLETRRKLSIAFTGRKHTLANRRKMARLKKGKKLSPAHVEAMRESWRRKIEDDDYTPIRATVACARKYNSSIENAVCDCLKYLAIEYQRNMPFFKRYVADIYLPRHKCIIECDGNGHQSPEGVKHDRKRDARFKEEGYKITHLREKKIRFTPMTATLQALRRLGIPCVFPK